MADTPRHPPPDAPSEAPVEAPSDPVEPDRREGDRRAFLRQTPDRRRSDA